MTTDHTPGEAFSAPGSALGIMVQIDYALLLVLQRMEEDVDFEISIETLDDIVIHDAQTANPTDLVQTKYHVSRMGGIGDSSPDLWKTLHNWIVQKTSQELRLFLATTATAAPGSAAHFLKGGVERNSVAASSVLERVAVAGGNAANAGYYSVYLALSNEARIQLLQRVVVLDSSYGPADLNDALLRAVRKSVFPNRRQALIDRVRGWWQRRVSRHLVEVANHRPDRIALAEVEDYLLTVAQSLRDDDLPIDFAVIDEPKEDEVSMDTRIFVEQLRLIQMGSQRLRQCIYDHNRAFLQRSQWQREDLLNIGELGRYDESLKDEWRRHFTPVSGEVTGQSEADIIVSAQDAFHRLDTSALPRIRQHVSAGYVANGSLHMLADNLRIGWHPRWLDHLRHRLAEVENVRTA